jgi:hypothetical protein
MVEGQLANLSTSKFLLALAVASFTLNTVWEYLHQRAFAIPPFPFYLAMVCAFGDLLITAAVYLLGSLANGSWHWCQPGHRQVYLFASAIGFIFALATEWFALWTGRWAYSEWMPIVPFFRVGLLPVLQLSLLTPLSFYFGTKIASLADKHNALSKSSIEAR